MTKSQDVRWLDVYLVGPLILFAAGRDARLSNFWRVILGVTGLLTMIYNGENWRRTR